MKSKDALKIIQKLSERASKDNDTLLICYFSREDDRYEGNLINLDKFDLDIILQTIKPYISKKFIKPPKFEEKASKFVKDNIGLLEE